MFLHLEFIDLLLSQTFARYCPGSGHKMGLFTWGKKKALDLKIESLSVCQDILLLKGEGEVKLNMVMGKAELALRSYGAAGQEVVRSQLQEAEDAWATLLVAAMSCHR